MFVCKVTASFISPLPGRGVSSSYRARLQRDAPSFPNLHLPPRYITLIKIGPALTATSRSLIQIPQAQKVTSHLYPYSHQLIEHLKRASELLFSLDL